MRFRHPHYDGGREVEVRIVRADELLDGMVALSWSLLDPSEPSFRGFEIPSDDSNVMDAPYTVTGPNRLNPKKIMSKDRRGRVVTLTYADAPTWFAVVTSGGDFPHSCPLCGQAAYVGAVTRVSHAVVASCPDR